MGALSRLLQEQRDAIAAEWLRRVEALPAAQGLPAPVLEDNVPQILSEIAECLDGHGGRGSGLDALPSLHALDRYKIGFDVRAVITEYSILRQVILERLPPALEPEAQLQMHQLLDQAVAAAVDHFALERDRAREIFVAMLGHDLRNPLGAISMATQQLLSDPTRLRPEQRRLVVRVMSSATRIERMADDLLDFARGRVGGGVPVTVAPLDLTQIICDVVDEFHEAFPDRAIHAAPEGDLRGEWDGDRLAQMVSNLIANALEHGTDPIEVSGHDEGPAVTLEVRNQGTLPGEVVARVFDPFVSLHAMRSGRRGLGLGLYIVREIARAHGGEVEPRNERGSTVFRVVLPRRAPHP